MTYLEKQANDLISEALSAIQKALEASEKAGYGSQVLGPLEDASRSSKYALDVAKGSV